MEGVCLRAPGIQAGCSRNKEAASENDRDAVGRQTLAEIQDSEDNYQTFVFFHSQRAENQTARWCFFIVHDKVVLCGENTNTLGHHVLYPRLLNKPNLSFRLTHQENLERFK